MSAAKPIEKRYGLWTVIDDTRRLHRGGYKLLCACDCGTERLVFLRALRDGRSKGCGCNHSEAMKRAIADKIDRGGFINVTHGQSNTPVYKTWVSMNRRCSDPASVSYPFYGALGVSVCEEWRSSFAAFYAHVGDRPKGHTIDRYPDQKGDYRPGNVRWATPKQQLRNICCNHNLTHNGRTQCLTDWAAELGVTRQAIFYRVRAGWSVERALTEPFKRCEQNRIYEFRGQGYTLRQLAAMAGITKDCLRSRLSVGETLEEAMARPSIRPPKPR